MDTEMFDSIWNFEIASISEAFFSFAINMAVSKSNKN